MLALTPVPLQTAGERALFAELTRWDTGGSVRAAVVASIPLVDGPMDRRLSDAVLFVPEGIAVVRIVEVVRQSGVVTAKPEGAWTIGPEADPGDVLQLVRRRVQPAGRADAGRDGHRRQKLRRAGLEPGRIARLTVLAGDVTGLVPADGDLGEGDQVALLEPRSLLLGIARASRYTGVDNPRLWTTADVRAALEALGLQGRGPLGRGAQRRGLPVLALRAAPPELLTPAAMAASPAPRRPPRRTGAARAAAEPPRPRRSPAPLGRAAQAAAAPRRPRRPPRPRSRPRRRRRRVQPAPPEPPPAPAPSRRPGRPSGDRRRPSPRPPRDRRRSRRAGSVARSRSSAAARFADGAGAPAASTAVHLRGARAGRGVRAPAHRRPAAPRAAPAPYWTDQSRPATTTRRREVRRRRAATAADRPSPASWRCSASAGGWSCATATTARRERRHAGSSPPPATGRRARRSAPCRPSTASTSPCEAVDTDDTCVGHAYGGTADFFETTTAPGSPGRCTRREIGGEPVVVSVSRVRHARRRHRPQTCGR